MTRVNIDIKPIPQYIEKRIRKLDLIQCPQQKGLRFYCYFTKMQGDLVKISVAMRNKNKKTALMKQVAVHGVKSKKALVKDMEYNYLGLYTYRVGWYDEGIKYRYDQRPWYNDGCWYSVDCKYYNTYGTIVNPEFVLKQKEYKYSAIELYKPFEPIRYLKLYREFPQLELMVKHGFKTLATSKMILRKLGKDKNFAKWLIQNKDKLGGVNRYYVNAVIGAYNKTTAVDIEQAKLEFILQHKSDGYKELLSRLSIKDLHYFIEYLVKQNTNYSSYRDYVRACEYLKLDMTLEKNLFPKNFKRWHDIRIDEYNSAKALEDAERRKKLELQFASVANKYLSLEHNSKGNYVVVIAKSPEDLITEGDALNHCVGKMNYDQKFLREETLIFFVRNKESVETPFVTMEYSVSKKKILQGYGLSDSRPDQVVLDYVNKKWLPYANKQMKRLAA